MFAINVYYPPYVSMEGYWSLFFLCPVTDISAMVAPTGVKFCMMVHINPGQEVSPFGGGTPRDPQNLKFWA